MGFFSWLTQDTGKSIPSKYSSHSTITVTMTDDKGNKWTEQDYEGYGEFGGKDFYSLLAEMNGKKTRDDGIGLAFGDVAYISPNLSEASDWTWVNKEPELCEEQGFFYQ